MIYQGLQCHISHPFASATAARDTQIRVFDIKATLPLAITSGHVETEYSTAQTCIAIIRCHSDAVKKIVTEDSPDLFLSVSEV